MTEADNYESWVPSDYEDGEVPGYVPKSRPSAASPRSPKSEKAKGTVSYQSTNVVNASCVPQTQAGGLYTQWEDSEEEQETSCEFDRKLTGSDKAKATRTHLHRKKGKVYLLTNLVNGRKYVGQTIQAPSDRYRQHATGHQKQHTKSGGETYLRRAIDKYGWDKFERQILEKNIEHDPPSILDAREVWWIQEMGSLAPAGYNLEKGGTKGNAEWTDVKRKRHSVTMKAWANQKDVRERKKEVWADPEFKAARCVERKANQNKEVNVEARRRTWAAKRDAKLATISDPLERKAVWINARKGALASAKKATKRGAPGRDPIAEFYDRWGSDKVWAEWVNSSSTEPPRGCP